MKFLGFIETNTDNGFVNGIYAILLGIITGEIALVFLTCYMYIVELVVS